MQVVMKATVLLSAFLMSACTSGGIIGKRDTGQALVNKCMFETGVKGAYSNPAGQKVPVLTPVTAQGGTQRGATILNACIANKAAATGSQSTPSGTTTYDSSSAKAVSRPKSTRSSRRSGNFCPKHASVIYGGSRYCVGNQ